MTTPCPCCGAPVEGVPAQDLIDASLSMTERKIVDCLIRAYPRRVTNEHLIEFVYGDRWDGGPEDPSGTLKVITARLRKKLPEYGWEIPYSKGGPGNYGSYQLSKISE